MILIAFEIPPSGGNGGGEISDGPDNNFLPQTDEANPSGLTLLGIVLSGLALLVYHQKKEGTDDA